MVEPLLLERAERLIMGNGNEQEELNELMEDEEENDGEPLSNDEVQWMINRSIGTSTKKRRTMIRTSLALLTGHRFWRPITTRRILMIFLMTFPRKALPVESGVLS
jgi:hypothetical protein